MHWEFLSSAARWRWRRVGNPVHVALIQGVGHITPSQDHTPSLACQIILDSTWGSPELPIRW